MEKRSYRHATHKRVAIRIQNGRLSYNAGRPKFERNEFRILPREQIEFIYDFQNRPGFCHLDFVAYDSCFPESVTLP